MKRILLLLTGLFLALAAPPGHAQDTSKAAETRAGTNRSFSASSPNHRANWQRRLTLGPGDMLNFSLYDQPETARKDLIIGPDGRITFLQAEDILATGLTIDELRARFDMELAKYYRNPRTIISPGAYRSKKYYILGAVTSKGVYSLDRPTTMIEAIARAGGLETGLFEQNPVDLADLSHSFVVRGGKRLEVDFEKLFQQGDLSQNMAIEPDDYVYFPSANANQIYVVGAVVGPGILPYTPNASVVTAITARGGFGDKAYQSKVLVIRGSLNAPETFVVNTKAILAAESPDFKLKPKDIVFVARRPWALAEEILDSATMAFVKAAVVTWTGQHAGPLITEPIY
jgi:protein involved in polysaccharide export with SLBB domain